MVRIVNLDDQIGDAELELVRPKPCRFVARRQIQARAEIKQDICGLRDDEPAGFEERWRKRRTRAALFVDDLHHRRHAGLAFAARDIDIVGAAFLQRQPDELAAPLDRRPVVKLVAHQSTGLPVALERCVRVRTNVFERGQASQRRVRSPTGSFIRAVICLTYSFSNAVSRCLLAISTAESVLSFGRSASSSLFLKWPKYVLATQTLVS